MLTHKGTQTIETPRLLLRKAQMTDAQDMFGNWASDPEVTKYVAWPTYKTLNSVFSTIKVWLEEYPKADYYVWLIILKEIDQNIGAISVVDWNDSIKKAEIGYCLGSSWWYKGMATEALKAVIDFLFDEVGMNRIEAVYDPNNPHSGSVMRKCGMQYEGTARAAGRNNQGICDACHYAILRNDPR